MEHEHWISIPRPGYGGIEVVVALLTDDLVRRGNSVTLFCAPGSRSNATIHALLDQPHGDRIGAALLIHTLHGEFNPDTARFSSRHGALAALVAISRSQLLSAPGGLEAARVIPNPSAARSGHCGARTAPSPPRVAPTFRSCSPARSSPARRPSSRRRWSRCSTGDASPTWERSEEGAANEIIMSGENGFLVADEAEMASAVGQLSGVDPHTCRESVAHRYDVVSVAAAYEAVYREAAAGTTAHYGSGLGLGAPRANGRAAAGDLLAASAPGDRAPREG